MSAERKFETATIGGGCFWCIEAVFEQVRGVESAISGYAGGTTDEPSYREVLEIFFAVHDPTTRNRQGADVGTQYRSVIYWHSQEQRKIAEEVIAELNASGAFGRPIVTELSPLPKFWRAEEYHLGYYRNNPNQGYCQVVISPKVAKLRQKFADKLKS